MTFTSLYIVENTTSFSETVIFLLIVYLGLLTLVLQTFLAVQGPVLAGIIVQLINCVQLLTIQSMEFSRPEYWNGQPIPSPADLPNPEIKPGSPALQMDSLPTELPGKISCLSHSIVFLYFFALTTEEGFLMSPCCSLELCVQMGVSFLFSFVFSFSSFLRYL